MLRIKYKIDLYLLKNITQTKKMTKVMRIPNIENYSQEFINGELILIPKKQYMTENEFNMTEFKYSTIEKCEIKKE